MRKKRFWGFARVVLIGLAALIGLSYLVRVWTDVRSRERIYRAAGQTPQHAVAIVFGAGIRNGYPSTMLNDRIVAAAELYKGGKVSKLLMSGDGDGSTPWQRNSNYNEPDVMRQAALRLGVADADILLDYAGRSTYETCYRAHDVYGLGRAVLVTQEFHLDRAMFTCDMLGMQTVGLVADRRAYRAIGWYEFREVAATMNALIELFVTKR
jgi:vancomycin permeability regulator SanA